MDAQTFHSNDKGNVIGRLITFSLVSAARRKNRESYQCCFKAGKCYNYVKKGYIATMCLAPKSSTASKNEGKRERGLMRSKVSWTKIMSALRCYSQTQGYTAPSNETSQ